MSTHAEDLKLRLMTIELLRTAKKQYTYRKLSSKTGLPVTVLSRYAKGHVLPNTERARHLWRKLSKMVGLKVELRRRIMFNDNGYFDNTNIIGDYNLLRQAANHALATFAGRRVTKVLTAAVDGIPLATKVADALGVNLVIAKWTKEVGVPAFFEETYVLSNSGVTMTLYVPKHAFRRRDKIFRISYEIIKTGRRKQEEIRAFNSKEAQKKFFRKKRREFEPNEIKILKIRFVKFATSGDSVLIVDDMIRTGETQAALVNLVRKAKADITGIYALIALGDEWRKKIKLPPNCPVEVITKI